MDSTSPGRALRSDTSDRRERMPMLLLPDDLRLREPSVHRFPSLQRYGPTLGPVRNAGYCRCTGHDDRVLELRHWRCTNGDACDTSAQRNQIVERDAFHFIDCMHETSAVDGTT